MKRIFRIGETTKEIQLSFASNPPQLLIDGALQDVRVERLSETEVVLWRGASPARYIVSPQKNGDILLSRRGECFTIRAEEPGRRRTQETSGSLSSPMPGKVIRVAKQAGDSVKKGEALVVVEAMKMELPIKATRDGVIKQVLCALNEKIAAGAVLVELE